ncbi:MAG: T9SS type A sorting domain-containing protein [Flavobacterium sp.]
MNKKLPLFLFLLFSTSLFAQELLSENFEQFSIGNIGTDFTGATSSNGIFTVATNGTAPTTANNAGNANFQIVANDAAHQNVLQITGTNGDKGSRQLWYDGFADIWSFRDAGNEILEIEFDMYTGNTSGTSVNSKGLYIFDATRTKILAGFSFNTKTLALSGVGYYTSATAPIGNYIFYLGAGTQNIILQANVWVRLGVSFNKTTGQIRWKGPGINGQVPGAGTGSDPDRVSLVSTSGTTTTAPIVTNTAAAVGLFDAFVFRATATDNLLSVDEISALPNQALFSVYPNPSHDVITVSSAVNSAISTLTITDINGRVVKQIAPENIANQQISITDLTNGVYFLTIQSSEGTFVEKLIKN